MPKSVSTVRYFGPCPTCGWLQPGGEVTYDVCASEVEQTEQTHGCCPGPRPETLVTVELHERNRRTA